MKSKQIGAIFLTVMLCLPVAALETEAEASRAAFSSALSKNNFFEIERLHNELSLTGNRTRQETYLAQSHVDFSSLTDCHRSKTKASNNSPKDINSEAQSCLISQEARLANWSANFPDSIFPILAKSAIFLDKVNERSTASRLASAEREKILDSVITILDSVQPKLRESLWYAMRIEAATASGMGSREFWALFNEATTKYAGHSAIYRKAAIHFLPKNGGSSKELDQLAQFVLNKNLGAVDSSLYAHIYDEVIFGQGNYGRSAYYKTRISWPMMKLGLLETLRLSPTLWNLNRYARHACMANDIASFKEVLPEIMKISKTDLDNEWGYVDLDRCKALAARE